MPLKVTTKAPSATDGKWDAVQHYKAHLQASGTYLSELAECIRTVTHLITWLSSNAISIRELDIRVLRRFLNHQCTCPGPHGYRKNTKRARRYLHRFLAYLLETQQVRMPVEIETGGRVIESFLQLLEAQGYVPASVVAYRSCCRHFIVWLYLNDIALAKVTDEILTQFLSHDCTCAQPNFFLAQSAGSRAAAQAAAKLEHSLDI